MTEVLNTDIYGITAEKYSLGRNNIEVVKKMINSGIKIIQYREKEKSMKEKFEEASKIKEITEKAGVKLIINDHIDLAQLIDAEGVHLGQQDLPVREARNLLEKDKIIGLSTHSPEQALDAQKQDIDYIGVGPIFETSTKKDVCDPVGLEYLEFVVENIKLPFVAIGGIKEHNIEKVANRGANCIAMVTEIVGSENISKKIRNIRNKMESEI